MTPQKWRAIERLYLAVLECDAGERADFLRGACGADEDLRREVASLLAYQPRAGGFLESAEPAGTGEAQGKLRPQLSPPTGRLTGRVFGSYEVQALIAAGGMGEVYQAFDTQLRRTVAIKVLPEHLSDQSERRERLKREAMLISSLNHPHICALYHVGAQDGLDYLVMEHIDGQTLQERLKRGRMHWAEAVKYLIEIADALDVAHRQGIVHRDLKPANVMLTTSGAKVLDFGLAARRAPDDSALGPAGGTDLSVTGRIMGTVPYMSPEQLQGKPADARTDIFAFGALAYEMISGTAPFTAESQADLIGAILRDDPQPLGATVPDVPPLLARTVARCLAKNPQARWQTAADLLFELRTIADSNVAPVSPSRPFASSRRVNRALWTAAIAASLAVGVWQWVRKGTVREILPLSAGAARFSIPPPEATTVPSSFDIPFALSPDGRWIVFVAIGDDGVRQMWIRALDSEQQRRLAGTEGANAPFWSPDSEWVAFFAAGGLKKVRLASPIAQVIATPASTMGGAAWSRNDVIVFPGPGGLHRVSANGGEVSVVTHDTNFHLWPQFLADGEHYIYSSFTPRRLLIGSLAGGPGRMLMTFPVNVSALAYVSGFVLFVQDGVLFARPFDERRMEFAGAPQRVLDGIPVSGPGRAPFSASATGVLAFSTDAFGLPAILRWIARDGDVSSAINEPAKYFGFSLSPDGRQLAFSRVGSNDGPDLWLRNFDTGVETQLTFDGSAYTPRWSPDGSRLLFTGIVERPPPTLFIKNVRQAGAAYSLGVAPGPQFAASWSGDYLLSAIAGMGRREGDDLVMQRVAGGPPERVPIDTDANESDGRLSPDGQWIAYTSDQSGREEVWVASFPSGKLRRQVSSDGGTEPQWCDQRELVYLAADRHFTVVPFRGSADGIELGDHAPLFRRSDVIRWERTLAPTVNNYAATADCGRFLVAMRPPNAQALPIHVVVNWPALLAR